MRPSGAWSHTDYNYTDPSLDLSTQKTVQDSVDAASRLELYDYNEYVCRVVVARVVAAGSTESESYPVGFGVRIVDINDSDRAKLKGILARASERGSLY